MRVTKSIALEGAMQLRLVGDVSSCKGAAQKPAGTLRFDENTFAVGIGALGQDSGGECRFGEFSFRLRCGGLSAIRTPPIARTSPSPRQTLCRKASCFSACSGGRLIPAGPL